MLSEDPRPMDAQQMHDAAMVVPKPSPEQVQMMSDYLGKIAPTSSLDPSSVTYDPIAAAMARHPMLTREKAEETAKAFGF